MSHLDKAHPLYQRALLLEYLTITWNVLEGLSCMGVGLFIGSVALFAYGLESSVEVFSSAVVVWDLKNHQEETEKTALRLIGVAYLIVSAYIFIDAATSLFQQHHPDKSLLGIILIVITALMMLGLGLAKRNVGLKMVSSTILADAKFTLIDGLLASTVLIGLVFNMLLGWWWMDEALALFLAGVAFREGIRELL